MGYELLIRRRDPAHSLPEALLQTLDSAATLGLASVLQTLPPAGQPPQDPPAPSEPQAPVAEPSEPGSPGGPWIIANGPSARIKAQLFLEEGLPVGADLDVALGGSEAELRDALQLAAGLSRLPGLLLFDPQLGREVASENSDEVIASWRQLQSWSVDYAGSNEDPRSLVDIVPAPPLLNPRNRIIFIVLGLMVALYVLLDVASSAFKVLTAPPEPPPPVEGPITPVPEGQGTPPPARPPR